MTDLHEAFLRAKEREHENGWTKDLEKIQTKPNLVRLEPAKEVPYDGPWECEYL